MNKHKFWKLFRRTQKELSDAFKNQDTFYVGYHLGVLHSLRFYGIVSLGIPASKLIVMEEF